MMMLFAAAFATPPLPLVHIKFFSPIFSSGGYASEGRDFILALHSLLQSRLSSSSSLSSPVLLSISHHGDGISSSFLSGLDSSTSQTLKHLSSPSLASAYDEDVLLSGGYTAVICHSEPGAWNVVGGPRWSTSLCPPPSSDSSRTMPSSSSVLTFGRTMFETDRLPSGWEARVSGLDYVLVPSGFAADVFVKGGVPAERVLTLGEPVDCRFFDPERVDRQELGKARAKYAPEAKEDTHVFFSVFKFEERKGWELLLGAYFSSFTALDDVLLLVLTSSYHSATDPSDDYGAFLLQQGLSKRKDLPQVRFVTAVPQRDLPALYAVASSFVLPTRGEGWGRPIVESMCMAKPVITTMWSGPTAFLNANNGFGIRIEGLVPVLNGPFKGHLWAQPSKEHLAELMKRVRDDVDGEATRKGVQARADMLQHYTGEKLATELLDIIMAKVQEREQQAKNQSHDAIDEL